MDFNKILLEKYTVEYFILFMQVVYESWTTYVEEEVWFFQDIISPNNRRSFVFCSDVKVWILIVTIDLQAMENNFFIPHQSWVKFMYSCSMLRSLTLHEKYFILFMQVGNT